LSGCDNQHGRLWLRFHDAFSIGVFPNAGFRSAPIEGVRSARTVPSASGGRSRAAIFARSGILGRVAVARADVFHTGSSSPLPCAGAFRGAEHETGSCCGIPGPSPPVIPPESNPDARDARLACERRKPWRWPWEKEP